MRGGGAAQSNGRNREESRWYAAAEGITKKSPFDSPFTKGVVTKTSLCKGGGALAPEGLPSGLLFINHSTFHPSPFTLHFFAALNVPAS